MENIRVQATESRGFVQCLFRGEGGCAHAALLTWSPEAEFPRQMLFYRRGQSVWEAAALESPVPAPSLPHGSAAYLLTKRLVPQFLNLSNEDNDRTVVRTT